tara:strand:+ start:536 stop:829 length:294 start_codon:yes stop_codon:yes gene_type:complete
MCLSQIKSAKRIRCPVKLEPGRLEQVLTYGVEHTETHGCGQWVSTQTVFDKIQRRSLSKLIRVTRIKTQQGIIQAREEKPATAVGESDYPEFLWAFR